MNVLLLAGIISNVDRAEILRLDGLFAKAVEKGLLGWASHLLFLFGFLG